MDNLSDSTLKLKYNKCKLKLKVWESNYRNKTGKNPSKDDIKEAPLEIRDAYKWYWQIKIHSLGQDSLLDATFVEKKSSEDEASESSCEMTKGMLTPLECQERAEEPKTSLQSTSCSLLNEAKILSDQTGESAPQQNESEPQPAVSLSDTIWGSHLNKTQSLDSSAKSTKSLTRSSSSFQLSEKLFLGAKFKKRNPRKSLSFSVGRGKEKGNLVSSESFSGVSGTCSSTDFSQGTEDGFPISDLENELSVENIEKVQNCDFVMVKRSVSNMQPISAVQKMMEDDSKSGKPKIERNLDKGWLERVMCTDHILNLEARENKDAAFSSMPSEDSDEDIIYASDNESNSPRKMEKEEKARLALRSNTALEVPAVMQKCNEKPKVMSALEKNDEKFRKRKVDAIEAAMALLTEKRKLERVPPNKKYKTSNEENEDHVNSPNENSTSKTVLCKKSCKLENSKKESLEKRVANGTINENFVRINVKKKVFVRGKKTMNFQKYKKQQWKNKKKELSDQASAYLSRLDPSDSSAGGGLQKCFKCGDVGHFAKQCTQMKGDSLMPNEDEEVEESPFPSLADVEKMAKEKRELVHYRKMSKHIEESSASTGIGNSIQSSVNTNETLQGSEILGIEDENISFEEEDDRVMNVMKAPTYEPDKKFRSVDPLYLTKADGSLQDTPSEVFDCLKKFGHKNFRPGQEVAIMRILSGLSTLVTLCTGSGKSLCYQLPAYLYASKKKCITLVVSPLVSLMDDQISGLPSFINGAALHTNQTEKQREKVIDLAKSGKLQFLLVSPEAVVAGERQSGFGSLLRSLPDIAFACIDEAHCVSQWSHNFRPSYLVLFKVLREKLGVQTILGLTATATQAAVSSIIDHIEIPDGRKGVIQDTPLPNNLILTVSCDSNRETGLLNLLLSSNFEDFQSVIVYCTRREECERLATLLRTCLKDSLKLVSGKGKLSTISEAYHAGLSAARRKQVQAAFMNGNVRIVVATVAFGMGINKADIRSVIHFNMPRNFESYVQEVGRSGRDGGISRCHLFLSSEGKDLNELRRHIHADSVDRHSIRKLLQRVFAACKCGKSNNDLNDVSKLCKNSSSAQAKEESTPQCVGHEVAFSVDETVAALDLPEENITTLLCYLELHDKNLLEVLPKAYTHCRIQSYKGMAHIRSVARTCPPLAMAIAMNYMSGKSDKTCLSIEFPVVEVASLIDWESGIVKKELRNLEWTQVDGRSRRSGMKVEFFNLGFRVKAPGNLSPEKLDAALDFLFQRVTDQEQSALFQLQTIFCAVTSVSYPSVDSMLKSSEADVDSHSNSLKSTVRAYFQEHKKLHVENLKTEEKLENGDRIASDVKQMVNMYRDCTFTGRAVARIFHGISSPNYPAQVWGRCRFWRAHLDSDFKLICLLATRVLLKMR